MNKRTTLRNGQLYKLSHERQGTWYFTSILKASAFCDVNYSYMYMLCNGLKRKAKEWTCEIVDDNGEIPRQLIDPEINDN